MLDVVLHLLYACLAVSLLAQAVSAESACMSHDCLSAPFLQHTVHVPPRGIDGSLHNIANGLNTFETRVPSWQVDRVLCPVALQTRTCFTRTVHAIDRPRHLESQCCKHRWLLHPWFSQRTEQGLNRHLPQPYLHGRILKVSAVCTCIRKVPENRHSSARGRISGICQTMMTSKIEITFPCLPDGGLLGGDGDCQSTASSSPLTRHVLLQFELLHVACLSTHVISSIREPVG
jgi:hypothetical protein